MEPVTITEQLMYTTTRLVTSDGQESGTGFFFSFNFGEGQTVPILITNKHVVRNNPKEPMQFFLHVNTGNNNKYENIHINLSTDWHFHPQQDLCFCFANPIFEHIRSSFGKSVVYRSSDESLIWSHERLNDLSAIEDVTMVGYPIGLWDEKNNFPIFRRGNTAAHPAIDFNKNGIGLVDMACFPGSSGSPIFIINESGYHDKKGTVVFGRSRVILLGIQFAVPVMNVEGELVMQNIPTQQKVVAHSKSMVNLGYYIKADEILKFKPVIKAMLNA